MGAGRAGQTTTLLTPGCTAGVSNCRGFPLYQPFVNVAMQKNISGYQYWFHRRLDYRAMAKG